MVRSELEPSCDFIWPHGLMQGYGRAGAGRRLLHPHPSEHVCSKVFGVVFVHPLVRMVVLAAVVRLFD